jgi:hypothetical protein
MIRRLIARLRLVPRPAPVFQDVILVRVQRGVYDWSNELDGGVR